MNNLKLLKIEFLYYELINEVSSLSISNLSSIVVTFSYKNISNAKMQINTNKELTIEEIKERILSELKG
ncbi:hypothetical protein [Clostridium intestinale]|uniref:Uncharacterized protein n=1 Tax=Clostridium intestinale DSM 6191 TaxID=1121320 RepID=A0A1M5U123_9CLOT|nr:hypothetical protein [Clostridium intestinale]SHH56737.1 hypothetical protein SAMN02745941_00377 [Clostridium intestinale DSM 6191]